MPSRLRICMTTGMAWLYRPHQSSLEPDTALQHIASAYSNQRLLMLLNAQLSVCRLACCRSLCCAVSLQRIDVSMSHDMMPLCATRCCATCCGSQPLFHFSKESSLDSIRPTWPMAGSQTAHLDIAISQAPGCNCRNLWRPLVHVAAV